LKSKKSAFIAVSLGFQTSANTHYHQFSKVCCHFSLHFSPHLSALFEMKPKTLQ